MGQCSTSKDQVDSTILNLMENYHIPGLSAIVVKDDQFLFKENYGWATLETQPVSDSTIFVMASSCKTVIVTALMHLWENGAFELEDNINNYLPFNVFNPDYPSEIITFQMLLTHSSSIADNWTFMQFYVGDCPVSLGDFLENYFTPGGAYYDSELNFNNYAPGDNHWEYSNIGASLAAYLVESITEIPFDQYCSDSIFSPLEMTSTSWFLSGVNQNNVATPYGFDLSSNQYYPYFQWGVAFYPAGQLRSTAVDLSKFIEFYLNNGAYLGNQILDGTTIDIITSTYLLNWQGLIWRYQYGLWWHSGRSVGSSSMLSFDKNSNIGVIYVTNGEIPNNGYDWRWDMHDILYDFAQGIITSSKNENIQDDYYDIMNLRIFPNPIMGSLSVSYELIENATVRIDIFNNSGNLNNSILNSYQGIGNYCVSWDCKNLNRGVYFVIVSINKSVKVEKILKL